VSPVTEPLRILFLPVGCLPWVHGGREVYAFHLARGLADRGLDVRIALHQNPGVGEPPGPHVIDGLPVEVLAPAVSASPRAARYRRDADEAPGFRELLDRFRPHAVHLHDFSARAGLTHLREARRAGAATVMTYHTPGQSCLETELLRGGRTVCDGRIRPVRCTACRLTAVGLPAPAAWAAALLPLPLLGVERGGPVGRVLTARNATDLFVGAWAEMVRLTDVIHAHAAWVADLLRLNGVPEPKLLFRRTGLPRVPRPAPRTPAPDGRLRVVFVGRCEPIKGIHVLIEAVKRLPADAPVEVSLVGPYWDSDHGRRLSARIAGDRRFRAPEMVPHAELDRVWAEADVCVVPSTWLETGPLVALEAFAAGVPVVGSRLGGIAELVTDGTDGLLFEPGDAAGLAGVLSRLLGEPGLRDRLAAGIRPPRTLADLAAELAEVYRGLVGHDAASAPQPLRQRVPTPG
jgi:glycosyltransferase involved in cell wall biosynthesis